MSEASWNFVPWHQEEGESAVRDGCGNLVCTTSSDKRAKLIAAAPDLLESLKLAIAESGCDGDLCAHNWHEVARQAISKATS